MPGDEALKMDNTIRGKIRRLKVYGHPKRNAGEAPTSNERETWLRHVFEVHAYVQVVRQKTFHGDQKPEETVLLNPDPFAVSSIVKADDSDLEQTFHYLIRLSGSVPSSRIVQVGLRPVRTWVGGPDWPLGHTPLFVPAPGARVFAAPDNFVYPPGTVQAEYAAVEVAMPGAGVLRISNFPLGPRSPRPH